MLLLATRAWERQPREQEGGKIGIAPPQKRLGERDVKWKAICR